MVRGPPKYQKCISIDKKGVVILPFLCYNISTIKNKMSIKLALLKSGETIISDAKEIVYEENKTEVHSYLFENPYVISTRSSEKVLLKEDDEEGDPNEYALDVVLTPWLILSSDKKMAVSVDWVVTIVEPLSSIKEMYIDKSKSTVSIEEQTNE